ncbi:Gfo/Idh/MocA family oxidoreductase [Actinopolyspora saharensis]|uniref:Gfo/Idh/MocA family oxidoreductase n=1 Tax=Actinopolyspora saharensis TaxID=995062 RepID=UPI003F680ABD
MLVSSVFSLSGAGLRVHTFRRCERFDIVGVANSSQASAEKAAAACGLPRAFADTTELATSPDVDIVVVTVKVPCRFYSSKSVGSATPKAFAGGINPRCCHAAAVPPAPAGCAPASSPASW